MNIKYKIKFKFNQFNKNIENLAQIDKLQKLNEKYQILLAEESKVLE